MSRFGYVKKCVWTILFWRRCIDSRIFAFACLYVLIHVYIHRKSHSRPHIAVRPRLQSVSVVPHAAKQLRQGFRSEKIIDHGHPLLYVVMRHLSVEGGVCELCRWLAIPWETIVTSCYRVETNKIVKRNCEYVSIIPRQIQTYRHSGYNVGSEGSWQRRHWVTTHRPSLCLAMLSNSSHTVTIVREIFGLLSWQRRQEPV